MDYDISCRLGERTTSVRFLEELDEIFGHPSGEEGTRGDDLFVFDTFTAALFKEVPENAVVLERGEAAKNFASVQRILSHAIDAGIGRDGRLVAVGGGVVCDVTAFAASMYMRGIDVALVPTTLLSMVDASLGGKTGVDFHGYKNLAGTFHPADRVLIVPSAVDSLSDHEYFNGMAEILKHALLSGGKLLDLLNVSRTDLLDRTAGHSLTAEMVYESLLVKRHFIEGDPRETIGLRALLNFGHTFGHAYETVNGLSGVSHGEAVAWGMVRALEIGRMIGLTDSGYAGRAIELIRFFGYAVDERIGADSIARFLDALAHDKKNRRGKVKFVMQRNLADTFITELPMEAVIQTISGDCGS